MLFVWMMKLVLISRQKMLLPVATVGIYGLLDYVSACVATCLLR